MWFMIAVPLPRKLEELHSSFERAEQTFYLDFYHRELSRWKKWGRVEWNIVRWQYRASTIRWINPPPFLDAILEYNAEGKFLEFLAVQIIFSLLMQV